jgi:hypothetical protein
LLKLALVLAVVLFLIWLPLSLFPDSLVDSTNPPFLIFVGLMVVIATTAVMACGPADLSRHYRALSLSAEEPCRAVHPRFPS